MSEVRLQRLLAQRGVGSRRHCEKLIAGGRVAVNGRAAALGDSANDEDVVTVDGRPIPPPQRKVYLMLNKPPGMVVTRRDPGGRPTVMDLVPPHLRSSVFPVGRLDLPSEGLLLLTNDGELANRLLHPRYQIPKTYLVWVGGQPRPQQLARARRGIEIEPGLTAMADIEVDKQWAGGSLLKVVVHEGKKREVRRICEAFGLRVARLKRVAFGPLRLGELAEGTLRPLRPAEVVAIVRAVGVGARHREPDSPAVRPQDSD